MYLVTTLLCVFYFMAFYHEHRNCTAIKGNFSVKQCLNRYYNSSNIFTRSVCELCQLACEAGGFVTESACERRSCEGNGAEEISHSPSSHSISRFRRMKRPSAYTSNVWIEPITCCIFRKISGLCRIIHIWGHLCSTRVKSVKGMKLACVKVRYIKCVWTVSPHSSFQMGHCEWFPCVWGSMFLLRHLFQRPSLHTEWGETLWFPSLSRRRGLWLVNLDEAVV